MTIQVFMWGNVIGSFHYWKENGLILMRIVNTLWGMWQDDGEQWLVHSGTGVLYVFSFQNCVGCINKVMEEENTAIVLTQDYESPCFYSKESTLLCHSDVICKGFYDK